MRQKERGQSPGPFERRAPLGQKLSLAEQSLWPESLAQDQSLWCIHTRVFGLEGQSLAQKLHGSIFHEISILLFYGTDTRCKYSFVLNEISPKVSIEQPLLTKYTQLKF
jgi:hypothetical protein